MTDIRPSWLSDELYPFQSRYIDIDGHKLHYIDEGEGPVILFLHGNPTWSFLYRHIIIALRGKFRCIAPDLPGFGLSRAAPGFDFLPTQHSDIIGKFISELDLQDVTLMAQDYGGPIGLGAAGRDPDRFKRLIIGNTFAWPPAGALKLFSFVLGSPIAKFFTMRSDGFIKSVMSSTKVKGAPISDEVLAAYDGPFPSKASRYAPAIFPRELRKSRAFFESVEKNLDKLSHLPALFFFGSKDPLLGSDATRKRFESIFPNHRTEVLEGVSHFFQEEAPDEVVAAILDWWPE